MKKTAKIFSLLLATLMLAASLALFAACGDSYDEEITVYNWEDYIYSKTELQNDFNEYYKAKTGKTVKVNYSTFDTNETMLTNIINGDAVVDVIAPSEYAIEKLLQHDLLEKIDKTKVSTISNVNSAIYEAVRNVFGTFTTDGGETVDITDYFVPYMWGTVGILYNKDMIPEPNQSWSILWDTQYQKNVFMLDSYRDSMGITLKYLGYSMNSREVPELMAAKDKLIEQKQSGVVKAYQVDETKDKMVAGEAALALMWSGDAQYAIDLNDHLDYFVPSEGSNIWVDGAVILKSARNKENAEKFINFLCRPDIALKNFEYITYSTPNEAARELIEDESIRNSKIAFPDASELSGCETFKFLGDKNDAVYNELWREVKSK